MFFNQVESPGYFFLYFNSLSDKEVREIVLIKDDCPPSFVFNHFTKITDVALKRNYNFRLRKCGTRAKGTVECARLETLY